MSPQAIASRRQQGIFTVFTALALVVILGFAGLAIDTSRAMVVRAELQNAADSCALAASLELNGLSDSITRAVAAGRYVGGQRNRKDFQDALAVIPVENVTFSTSLNGPFYPLGGGAPISSRYVRCDVEHDNLGTFLLTLLGSDSVDLSATATAAVEPSQITCAIPMALCGTDTGTNFGLTVGRQYALDAGSSASGFFKWANLLGSSGSTNTDLTNAFMEYGSCSAPTVRDRCLGIRTGVITALDDSWNARFGFYKTGGAGFSPSVAVPDLSGHGYASGTSNNYANYAASQAPNRTSFQNSPRIPSYATPANVHQNYGAPYRRMAPIAVVNCGSGACGSGAMPLIGWACVLMLAPKAPSATGTWSEQRIEYLGRADDPASPCRTAGIPGGGSAIGPLVPVIVK